MFSVAIAVLLLFITSRPDSDTPNPDKAAAKMVVPIKSGFYGVDGRRVHVLEVNRESELELPRGAVPTLPEVPPL